MLDFVFEILQISRSFFILIFFVCLLVSMEVGRRLGKRRRAIIGNEIADEGAALVVGTVLGLLAFVLALNLSNATSRYEMRMDATLQEVNAIGTAMLQAGAVGGNQTDAMVSDLKAYLILRDRYVSASSLDTEIHEINAKTSELQNRIWSALTQRINESPTPAVTSLMNAINNAFDASTTTRLAMEFRMPVQVIFLLLMMSMTGIAAVGYQFGLTKRKGLVPGILLSLLWCVVITEILDIGSARIWSFRTDSRVYEWQMEGLSMPTAPK